jgi:GNAT superfamily N-acetyltransferase
VDPVGLALAADANLATHFTWVQRQTPGMRVVETADLVLTDGGLPCDTFCAACRARLDPVTATTRIRETIDWFAVLGHPFSWWVGINDQPEDLRVRLADAGLEHAESETAMGVDLDDLPSVDLAPGGLEVRRVRTTAELGAFAAIAAANWSPPDQHVIEFYRRAAPLILGPDPAFWFYLGFLEGTPVATSQLTIGGGVAGLYNVSTLASHRGRGFGTALTTRPLMDARQAGLGSAILQAAAEGVGLYRRLGFTPFGEIAEYKPRSR